MRTAALCDAVGENSNPAKYGNYNLLCYSYISVNYMFIHSLYDYYGKPCWACMTSLWDTVGLTFCTYAEICHNYLYINLNYIL